MTHDIKWITDFMSNGIIRDFRGSFQNFYIYTRHRIPNTITNVILYFIAHMNLSILTNGYIIQICLFNMQ